MRQSSEDSIGLALNVSSEAVLALDEMEAEKRSRVTTVHYTIPITARSEGRSEGDGVPVFNAQLMLHQAHPTKGPDW